MSDEARREYVTLAKTYTDKQDIGGWLVSEKLDGFRALWDGGISRGKKISTVPYASIINPRTGEPKPNIDRLATGLWSRYGNPIFAPDWFLNKLPCVPLDGELWAGRGNFQTCRSICSTLEPGDGWETIEYAVFDSPPLETFLGGGLIKNANTCVTIKRDSLLFAKKNKCTDFITLKPTEPFHVRLEKLNEWLSTDDVFLLLHKRLPKEDYQDILEHEIELVLDQGGEGLILRDPDALWVPKRVASILKYKPFNDAEAVITGYVSGKETDKGSKHIGRIGALIVKFGDKEFKLSGMTDIDRVFETKEMYEHAKRHPGEVMPSDFDGHYLKRGELVTFRYRELSDGGVPKEARFIRKV